MTVVATGLNGIGKMGDWGGIVAGDSLEVLTEKSDIDVRGVYGSERGTLKLM